MKNYIKEALRTDGGYEKAQERLIEPGKARILHAAIGASTEANEILDAVKKHLFYGKKLDRTNMLEEVGDLFWYLAILADELGFTFEQSMEANINKLRSRYTKGFSESEAINRNTQTEYEVLKNGI